MVREYTQVKKKKTQQKSSKLKKGIFNNDGTNACVIIFNKVLKKVFSEGFKNLL